MNAWRIALFIFFLQSSFYLVGLAQIPIQCTGTNCIYFNADTIRSTDMGSIIRGQVESSQFQATQINENIFTTDLFTFTAIAFQMLTTFLYMAVFGIAQMILFIFGSGAVSVGFAATIQIVVFFFYGRVIVDTLRPGGRGEI